MELQLSDKCRSDLRFSDKLPDQYKGNRMDGAEVLTGVQGNQIAFIQQVMERPAYTLRHYYLRTDKSDPIFIAPVEQSFSSLMCLENSVAYALRSGKSLSLQAGEFSVMAANSISGIKLPSGVPVQLLTLDWSLGTDDPLRRHFPFLSELAAGQSTGSSSPEPVSRRAGFQVKGIIHRLFNTGTAGNLQLLFEHRVREYMLLQLLEANRHDLQRLRLTQREKEVMEQIARMLRSNFNTRYSIAGLSLEAGINETKLKQAFREYHGITIGQLHLAARMEEAFRLLRETDYTTKEIAAMVNYNLTTSFITRFRQYFGFNPSEVRRSPK